MRTWIWSPEPFQNTQKTAYWEGFFHRKVVLLFLFCTVKIKAGICYIDTLFYYCPINCISAFAPMSSPVLCPALLATGQSTCEAYWIQGNWLHHLQCYEHPCGGADA